jgi:hypothetical protein
LEPSVGAGFTLDLFVPIAWSKIVSDSIWKRESQYDTFSRLLSALPVNNSNRNTNIEAAAEPVFDLCNMAHLGRIQAQMMSNNIFHPIASNIKIGEEALLSVEIP